MCFCNCYHSNGVKLCLVTVVVCVTLMSSTEVEHLFKVSSLSRFSSRAIQIMSSFFFWISQLFLGVLQYF